MSRDWVDWVITIVASMLLFSAGMAAMKFWEVTQVERGPGITCLCFNEKEK